MKNVLVVCPWLPYPLVSGGDQAIFNGLAVLDGCDNVYFTYPDGGVEKPQEAYLLEKRLPHVHVIPMLGGGGTVKKSALTKKIRHAVKLWMKRRLPSLLDSLVPQDPTVDMRFDVIDEGFVNHVNTLIEKYNINVVQVEMTQFISFARYLPNNVKKIFVHHELRWVANELTAQQKNLGWYGQEQVDNLKLQEIAMLNQFDEIVTLSQIDKEKLMAAGVTKPILASIAVVATPENLPEHIKMRPKTLSYVGPDLHYPNYDGVIWFLENCWEKILTRDPEYQFQIVGKWTEERRKEISAKYRNVSFTGFVENLGDAIRGTIMIVPLKIGSGIRMKILEAAQLEVPVVATPVGSEGLPVKDGEHAFITDDAETFVDDIFKLQDIALQKSLVRNMKDIIEKSYSIAALKENRRVLYD